MHGVIERAIVRRADAGVAVEEPAALLTGRRAKRRLTENEFYEEVGKLDAALPDRLRNFFERVEDIGLVVVAETASMVLRWDREDGNTVFFGIPYADGRLDTGSIAQRAEQFGDEQVGVACLQSLAGLIAQSKVKPTGNTRKWRLVVGDRLPRFAVPLERADEWLDAIQRTMNAFNRLAAD